MEDSSEVIDERPISNNDVLECLKKKVPHNVYRVGVITHNWAFLCDQLVHNVEKVDMAHLKELVAISYAAV
jgi:hypothetical protein